MILARTWYGTLDQSQYSKLCLQTNPQNRFSIANSTFRAFTSTSRRYSLVLYALASPLLDATNRKRRMLRSFDPTSPSTIGNIELIAAAIGSLTIERFFGAHIAVWLITPRRTGNTDKKKQRGEFHIHICKARIPIMRRSLQ